VGATVPEFIPVWAAEPMSDQSLNGLNIIEPYDDELLTFEA
jgi:hypothetical protein